MLPSDANKSVDEDMIIDTVHVIPGSHFPLSVNLSNINSPSSSWDLDNVDV